MEPKLIICLIIFAASIISYSMRKLPMAVTALIAMALYFFTGCIDAKTALAGFANTNTILIGSMFVISAGFSRTQFIKHCSGLVTKVGKGSITKIMAGYLMIASLLAQFIPSPTPVFTIMFPVVLATAKEMNISPSKLMFPLGFTIIGTCAVVPIGGSSSTFATYNGYLQMYQYTTYQFEYWDFFIARFPSMIFVLIYAIFVATKLSPSQPIVPINDSFKTNGKAEIKPLDPIREKIGYSVFILVTLALILQQTLKLEAWSICFVGALVMVVSGVLKEQEAYAAIPGGILMLYIGALSAAAALTATGAGQLIGDAFASAALAIGNNYIIAALFFAIPFILTQFMNNTAVINIFAPIAILTAKSLGGNPVGLCALIISAALCAFMTPMGTPSAPIIMGLGGYDIKSMAKQGIIPALGIWLITSVWVATCFPLLP